MISFIFMLMELSVAFQIAIIVFMNAIGFIDWLISPSAVASREPDHQSDKPAPIYLG
jgi:hypothetical protein